MKYQNLFPGLNKKKKVKCRLLKKLPSMLSVKLSYLHNDIMTSLIRVFAIQYTPNIPFPKSFRIFTFMYAFSDLQEVKRKTKEVISLAKNGKN